MSSVLPSKRRADPQRVAEVNDQIIATLDEIYVTFVDNDANFTFRNGAVDSASFQKDGLHLSESGVGSLLSNLSLHEQTLRGKNQQQQHLHEDKPNAA